LSTKPHLSSIGVLLTSTPAGLHQKRAERYIQTLKSKKRAMLAQLSYELPSELQAEAYMSTIKHMNYTSNKTSGLYTPHQLVTHTKPTIPKYYFGQTGVFHSLRQDTPDNRGEWGIFLSHGDTNNYLRAYFPLRHSVFSRRKFIPHDTFPSEWNLLPRLRSPSHNNHNNSTINQPDPPST
jgi:hypothetical protein